MNTAVAAAAEFEIRSVMGGRRREMRRWSNVVEGRNAGSEKGNRHD